MRLDLVSQWREDDAVVLNTTGAVVVEAVDDGGTDGVGMVRGICNAVSHGGILRIGLGAVRVLRWHGWRGAPGLSRLASRLWRVRPTGSGRRTTPLQVGL